MSLVIGERGLLKGNERGEGGVSGREADGLAVTYGVDGGVLKLELDELDSDDGRHRSRRVYGQRCAS